MRDTAMAPPRRLANDSWLSAGRGLAVLDHVLDAAVALHWHEFFELSYVTAGTGQHTVNGIQHALGPGDVLALTPADFHALKPNPGQVLHISNVIYTNELLPDLLRASLPPPSPIHLPHLAGDFTRMVADSRRTDPVSTCTMRATLTRLVADVVRAASVDVPSPAPPPSRRSDVQRALGWIDHHFRERIRLADAATVACLSPHHFSGVFREATGMSFQDYLINRRLQFARGLLASSALPVTQVCHAAGFNDLTHFSRSYRRRFGYPPSAQRNPG